MNIHINEGGYPTVRKIRVDFWSLGRNKEKGRSF